jgi:hypothetical protein
MYAFTDDSGKTKPGMITVKDGSGASIYLEVWVRETASMLLWYPLFNHPATCPPF